MSAPDAPVHYDVTRIALIDALGNLPLGEHLHLEPRARMADALLRQMPVASDAVFYMLGVTAERERLEAEHSEYLSQLTQEMDETLRAERDRIIALAERCYATCQDQNGDSMPFADAIREQP